MNKFLLSVSAIAILKDAIAFANTNADKSVWIAATVADGPIPLAQQSDLSQVQYEALLWTQIKGVGNHGEAGTSTNIVTYDTWDTKVTQKGKGISDAGSPTLELARLPTDPGQIAIRAAAKTNLNYAFKIVGNDKPDTDPGSTPTIIYNRGLVTGPSRPLGRNEDFDLEVFTFGFNQLEIVVDPTSGA